MSIESQDLYIPGIIKNGEFKLLRKYIPETLFYDTNLPYIIIREFLTNVKRSKHREIGSQVEIPELALSILVPGRVTFRYNEIYGHVIPLIKGSDPSSIKIPSNVFKLVPYPHIPSGSVKGTLVEEYRYVLEKLNKEPQCFYLEEVNLHAPENWFRLKDFTKEWGWQIYVKNGSKCEHYQNWYIRPIAPCIPNYINQLRSKTIAYPRIGVFYTATSYNSYTYKVGEEDILKLDYNIFNSIFRYVYAEDIRLHYGYVNLKVIIGNQQGKNKNLAISVLKQGSLKRRSKISVMAKILEVDDAPSAIGYEIKNSWGLRTFIQYKRPLRKIFNNFLECINNMNVCSEQYRKLCTMLTVCQVFVNALMYILTKDLYLNIIASNKQMHTLLELIDVALLYKELESKESICKVIAKPLDEAIEDMKSYILDGLRKLKESFDKDKNCIYGKSLIILRVSKGAKAMELLKSLQSIDETSIKQFVNEVGDRLKDLISKLAAHYSPDKWVLGLLEFVLTHTLNHHILKHVAKTSGFSVSYLNEYIDVDEGGNMRAALYEAVSGGIRAIEQTLISWGFQGSRRVDDILKLQKRHEDLLLTLGECPLGSAEDLLYMKSTTSKDLDVIITPGEREELDKVKSRFDVEIQTIATIWNLDYNVLKSEIIELVKLSDSLFLRFSNQDQILLTYLFTVNSWNTLSTLVRRVVIAALLGRKPNISEGEAFSIYLNFLDLLTSERCIEIGENKDPLLQYIPYIINGLRRVFVRLIPRSCNGACGMCYFNRSSCIHGDPYVQILLLNRRLLKLYATYLLEELGIPANDIYSKNCLAWVRLGDNDVCVPKCD